MSEYPTPEMIAAGLKVLWEFNPDSLSNEHDVHVVKKIFAAMLAAELTGEMKSMSEAEEPRQRLTAGREYSASSSEYDGFVRYSSSRST